MMTAEMKQAVADRLEELTARNGGRLTPEVVLADAQDEGSPLHAHFEWDDDKAAHQFRIEQARTLIRSVKVIIQTETKVVSTVRYVRDPSATSEEQGYVEVVRLRNDEDVAREALQNELRRIYSMLERARGIAEALGLAGEFDDILLRVERIQTFTPPRHDDGPRPTA